MEKDILKDARKEVTKARSDAEAKTPSKRDLFRERMGKRYPDLDMDDEDAYYDQMGKAFDEYEGYENSSHRLAERIKGSPAFRDMIIAAGQQDDFDPIIYLTEQRGLDLSALADDPKYADKLAEAHSKYIEKEAENKKIDDAMAKNMPASIEAIKAKASELGLSDDQTQEIVGKMYQSMDDMIHGILDPEYFALLAKGTTHDEDVDKAHDEGLATGLNKKVDDKLRTLENRQERVAGRQAPIKRPEPKQKRVRNMFLAGDEDEDYA